MNTQINTFAQQALEYATSWDDPHTPIWFHFYNKKFAELIMATELIAAACADAADAADYAQCCYPGDYVAEQLGYGQESGIVAWRAEQTLESVSSEESETVK